MASRGNNTTKRQTLRHCRDEQESGNRAEVITLVTPFDPDRDLPPDDGQRAIITVLAGPGAGQSYTLEGGVLVVGRDEFASVCIADPGLSRRHAEISYHGGQVFIVDAGSTNGTFVNGERTLRPQVLNEGERVQLGQSTVLQLSWQDRLEQQASQRQYELTVRDGLTGLYNRRYLDERIEAEFSYARRHCTDLALMILDVDYFKKVNDNWGHQTGDDVLRVVARGVSHVTRAEDLVARYGGEEFVVLARGIDANCALSCAERIRIYLASLQIPAVETRHAVRITVSFGVAHTEVHPYASGREMIAAADKALYEAKSEGRNRSILAESPVRPARSVRRRRVGAQTGPVLKSSLKNA